MNDSKIKQQEEAKVEPTEEPVVNVVVQDNRDPFYEWLLLNRGLRGQRGQTNPTISNPPARRVERGPAVRNGNQQEVRPVDQKKPARAVRKVQSSALAR